MTQFHRDAPTGDIHQIYQWSYSNATARLAATDFASSDVGKVALQVDTAEFYILRDESPITWQKIGEGGGGAGSFVWDLPDSNAPAEALFGGGVRVLDFSVTDEQEVWAFVRVPDTYIAGTQILLKGLAFLCSLTSGNVLFRATTYLVRTGAGNMSSTAPSGDSYASTNTQVAVSGTANRTKAVGDVDLTNSSGQINSVSVAAGDWLAIQLVRKTSSETSGAAGDARLIRYSGSPKFS